MTITPGCSQHIGSRKQQQDAFGFSHIEDSALVQRAGVLAVLADGMGGLALGQEAATTAVQTALQLHEQLDLSRISPAAFLADVVEQANDAVLDMARKAGVEGDAGATLLLVLLQDTSIHWASAGDSRIYLCRGTELAQLTTDQNHYTELLAKVSSGAMTIEQARTDPDRAALVNFIGNPDLKPADASIRPLPLQQNDWLLLCSDGLFGTLSTEEILAELHGSPQAAAERLISKALSENRPNQDNVTVAILGTGDREPVTVRAQKRAIPSDDPVMPLASAKRRFGLTDLLLGVVIAALVVAGGFYGLQYLVKQNKPLVQQIAPVQKSISSSEMVQKPTSSTKNKNVEQRKEQKP
jgi:PPM family protein phosphatase